MKNLDKIIKEFREKFRHCGCELWDTKARPSEVESFLSSKLLEAYKAGREDTLKQFETYADIWDIRGPTFKGMKIKNAFGIILSTTKYLI